MQLPCPPDETYYPNATCFLPNVTWSLSISGPAQSAADNLRLEVIQYKLNCNVSEPSLQYSFGNFYTDENCADIPLIGLTMRNQFSVFAFQPGVNASG